MVRFYLRFTGRVQGVGFRFFVAMNAERCHLTGWVKNMSDGSVTAEVQGTRVEIEKFLNLIQTGNRFIRYSQSTLKTFKVITDMRFSNGVFFLIF